MLNKKLKHKINLMIGKKMTNKQKEVHILINSRKFSNEFYLFR
jgi:hypothetical protein